TARVVADLQHVLVLVKGLPLAYNRDLQEDKSPLFDAHDTVAASLELAAALVREARWRKEAIAARLEDGFLDATTLMEYFVAQGLPMRAAHEAVGKLVRLCEQRRCRLADLPPEVFESVRPGLASGVYQVVGVANALAAFRSHGSTAPAEVARQVATWRQRLSWKQRWHSWIIVTIVTVCCTVKKFLCPSWPRFMALLCLFTAPAPSCTIWRSSNGPLPVHSR